MIQLFRFGGFYLLVRALTKEDFGLWTIFLIATSIIEVVRIGLIQNALIKALTANEEHRVRGRINTASFTLNILVALAIALLLIILARFMADWFGGQALERLLHIYILTNLLLVPYFQFTFIAQANFDFRSIFWSNFFRHAVFFGYVLALYLVPEWHFSLSRLALVQAIGAVVGSIVAWILGRRLLIFSVRLDVKWLGWLFNYGKYVIGTNLGSMLTKSLDQLMLGVMISPVATAVYGTAIKIANLVEVPTQSMAAIVFPKSAQRVEQEGEVAIKQLYEKSVGVLLALIIPGVLFVLVFPKFVIEIVAGPKYLDAVPLLRITMLYGLFVPFSRQFGTMLDAMGKPGLNFFMVMVGTLINGLLNFFMIREYGTLGAAYATLISFGLLFIANQVILYRQAQVQLGRIFVYTQQVYANGFSLLRTQLAQRLGR